MSRSMDATVECRELADDALTVVGCADYADDEFISAALVELEAVRTSLVVSLLSGSDRAGLVDMLDRISRQLRGRLSF